MEKRLKFLLDENSREDFANFEEMGLYKKSKKQRPLKEKKKDEKRLKLFWMMTRIALLTLTRQVWMLRNIRMKEKMTCKLF